MPVLKTKTFGITIASRHTITLYVQTCSCLNKFVIRTARNTGFNVRPFDLVISLNPEITISLVIIIAAITKFTLESETKVNRTVQVKILSAIGS